MFNLAIRSWLKRNGAEPRHHTTLGEGRMQNTSNAVTTDKAQEKAGPEKVSEKVAEKRRALGRGLESLLPGPRVVKPAVDAAQGERAGTAAATVPHLLLTAHLFFTAHVFFTTHLFFTTLFRD